VTTIRIVDDDRALAAGPASTPATRVADGSDRDRIGAGVEKSVLDTQPGPNRNGRRW
jgi:hypothetical protein